MLAAEFSDDIGSSPVAAILGLPVVMHFPAEMEEAIAALAVDVVSEPVQTDAGIHLILVTERREGKAPTLEEMRPRLEEQLQLCAGAWWICCSPLKNLKDLVFNAENLDSPAQELSI